MGNASKILLFLAILGILIFVVTKIVFFVSNMDYSFAIKGGLSFFAFLLLFIITRAVFNFLFE